MSQNDVLNKERVEREITAENERHNLELDRLHRENDNFRLRCDHKIPNGSSAWKSDGLVCSYCELCGKTDL